jgi:hypothetical protein
MNPRHSFRLVSLFLLFASLFCAAPVVGQISVPDFTPPLDKKPVLKPSFEAQAAQRQAPLSLVQKELAAAASKEIRLRALTAAERAPNTKQKKTRIGVLRPLPTNTLNFSDFSAVSQADGTLYLLRVVSPQAISLRLHLANLALPEGAALFAFSRLKPES